LTDDYIKAIIRHAKIYKGEALSTIYIGGGTPSVLSENQIQNLLSALASYFNLSKLKEWTFELNPESVTPGKLKVLKDYGVNRLSIGLQSANDSELSTIGRAHDFKMFESAFKEARKAGFQNISLDLIYGLPGQSLKSWKDTLRKAISFKSEHISLYPLSVEMNTPFYKNGIKTDDDLQRDMYEQAVKILAKAGYEHYEISNWAKNGKESLHNNSYWENKEYIALGSGASGYYSGERYKIIPDIKKYILFAGKFPLKSESEVITNEVRETESIILGLRLLNKGVAEAKFKSKAHKEKLSELLKQKLLILQDAKVKLPESAVFVSNQILSEFI